MLEKESYVVLTLALLQEKVGSTISGGQGRIASTIDFSTVSDGTTEIMIEHDKTGAVMIKMNHDKIYHTQARSVLFSIIVVIFGSIIIWSRQ